MDYGSAFIVATPRMVRYGPHVLLKSWNPSGRIVLAGRHTRSDAFECVRKSGVA
jgi:hypothetical protein